MNNYHFLIVFLICSIHNNFIIFEIFNYKREQHSFLPWILLTKKRVKFCLLWVVETKSRLETCHMCSITYHKRYLQFTMKNKSIFVCFDSSHSYQYKLDLMNSHWFGNSYWINQLYSISNILYLLSVINQIKTHFLDIWP